MSIDITVTGGISDTHVNVSDDDTVVVEDATDINFGTGLSATPDGDGSVTVDSDATQRTDESIQDLVAAYIEAGAELSKTYDDANDTLTLDFTGTSYSAEQARDDIAASLVGGTNVTIDVDDPNDTITINATDTDTQLTDSEVQSAINSDTDHGSTANHDPLVPRDGSRAWTGTHDAGGNDLTNVGNISPDSVSDAHHTVTQVALGGGTPNATNYAVNDVVEDSDNLGTFYLIVDDSVSSGFVRIDSGTGSNPLPADTPRIVAPSSPYGYDLLQTAIDDAAAGGSTIIWLMEDIVENVLIPLNDEANWNTRGGLSIIGQTTNRTVIEDAANDGTPILDFKTDTFSDLSYFTLKNIWIKGTSNSGRSININHGEAKPDGEQAKSTPFLKMVDVRTETPVIVTKPFFSYYENCNFISNAFTTWDGNTQETSVTTDTAFILNGGNLAHFARCTFKTETQETNWAVFWVPGFNVLKMDMPEFKIKGSEYDETAPRNVAMCLFDGAVGDITVDQAYTEGIADTDYRFAQTPATGGTPRAIKMINARAQHITYDVNCNSIEISTDGANSSIEAEVNSFITSDSVLKTPNNVSVTLSGSFANLLRLKEGQFNAGWDATNPNLPSGTGSSNTVQNNNNYHCLVYHNGSEPHVVTRKGGDQIAYGSPVYVPMRDEIYFTGSVPSAWNWYGLTQV